MENKRKFGEISGVNVKKSKLEVCPHGEKCYRRNPHHFKEYEHPHLNNFIELGANFTLPKEFPQTLDVINEQIEILKSLKRTVVNKVSHIEDEVKVENSMKGMPAGKKKTEKSTCFKPSSSYVAVSDNNTMLSKLEKASPYYIFFTKVPKAKETMQAEHTITFTDLLCPSLGELKCSLQLNFMIDVMWLMEQYKAREEHKKPLTILYGYEFPDMEKYMSKFLPNVTYSMVKMRDPFGTHHSKVGLYSYKDGSLRVVVSTANLYYEDWNHYNQGLWVSPTCKPLPKNCSSQDGESPTKFKATLIKYLESYNNTCLKEWIVGIKGIDFSHIKVFLVTSSPGKHYPSSDGSHIHRVTDILSKHCTLPKKTTPDSEGPLAWGINAQASTIGSLGKTPAEWLRGTLLRTLATHMQGQPTGNSHATLNVVYPTVDNVMKSYFGAEGGGCLPYAKNIHEKQIWLKDYLHQWVADSTCRTRVMPHIKTYCRISPCLSKLAWFLLTSANISKAAWGGNIQKDRAVYVRSYEVGVMFMPSLFDEEYFSISESESSGDRKCRFPFIYDLPLTAYKSGDYPWCN